MQRIMYDLTYAARGKSGIPKDTRSVANILQNLDDVEISYVISPQSIVPRYTFGKKNAALKNSMILNAVLAKSSFRLYKFEISHLFKSISHSLSFQPFVKLQEINPKNRDILLKRIGIKTHSAIPNTPLLLMRISYAARFGRPGFLGPFRIRTKEKDFYIQQHIDPIKVGSSTKHIVRLHDILPITHPFFFSEKARRAFIRGFRILLNNRKIIWVMDTEASKKDFIENFGSNLNVEVIPCEVGFGLNPQNALDSIKTKNTNTNTYLCVNTIEPRKNVGMVINSFLKSLKEDNTKFANELIIAGSYGWMEEELISKLRAGYYGQKIKFIENPDDSVIEDLYKSANFVISASEAEGFGLPPLEGMLFGCLPIVSNLPQHHENMGNKAIYFDLSENSLLDAISTSKKIPQTVRRKLALDAHNYVRNEFSHEALIIKWKKLLA